MVHETERCLLNHDYQMFLDTREVNRKINNGMSDAQEFYDPVKYNSFQRPDGVVENI